MEYLIVNSSTISPVIQNEQEYDTQYTKLLLRIPTLIWIACITIIFKIIRDLGGFGYL